MADITWRTAAPHTTTATFNGWEAAVANLDTHPNRINHPDGKPFGWTIRPGQIRGGNTRWGFEETLADAQEAAERNLRELDASRTAWTDSIAGALIGAMPSGATEDWGI